MNTIEKLRKKVNPKKEYKVSEEIAIDQLALMLDYYDVDLSKLNDEDSDPKGKHIESLFDNLVEAIKLGQIEIKETDKGEPILIQIVKNGQRLEYTNSIANAKANTKIDEEKPFKSNYQFAGLLCGVGEDGIRGLEYKDSKVAEYISSFFLKL